jgi:hypothetical protein
MASRAVRDVECTLGLQNLYGLRAHDKFFLPEMFCQLVTVGPPPSFVQCGHHHLYDNNIV